MSLVKSYCFTITTIVARVSSLSEENLSDTQTLLAVVLDFRVRRVFHQNENEFRLYGMRGDNFIKIPSANLHNGRYYTSG